MSFLDAMLEIMESQMLDAGLPAEVAHARARKAVEVIAERHQGEDLGRMPKRPRCLVRARNDEIREALKNASVAEVAKAFGVSERWVYQIYAGKWKRAA